MLAASLWPHAHKCTHWLLNYNAAENKQTDLCGRTNTMQHLVAWPFSYCIFAGWSFDCTPLLMVSHWFLDTRRTVSLLFYCILCSRLVGGWGRQRTRCSQPHLAIEMLHSGCTAHQDHLLFQERKTVPAGQSGTIRRLITD